MPERARHDGALTTDMKKASPDGPARPFSYRLDRDQRSSVMIPSVSPVPTQPS